MKPLLVGICGPENAGKSTVAKHLKHTWGADIIPFADTLKSMLLTLGVPRENLYGPSHMREAPLDILGGKTVRWAAQSLGTEWGRNLICDDLWVNAWLAKALQSEKAIIVADDLRFGNEERAVKSAGGIIIRVTSARAAEINRETCHASQRHWEINADYEIDNSGDLRTLGKAIDRTIGARLWVAA